MSSKYTHCYSNYVNHILNTSPTKITYTFPKQQRFSPSKKQKDAPIDSILQAILPSSVKKIHDGSQKQKVNSNKKILNNYLENDKLMPIQSNQSTNRKKKLNYSRQKNQIHPFDNYLKTGILREDSGKKISRSKSNKVVKFGNDIRVPAPFDLNNTPQKRQKMWDKGQSPNKQSRKRLYTQIQYSDNIKRDKNPYPLFLPEDTIYTNNKYTKYSPYYRQYLANNGQQRSISKQKYPTLRNLSSQKQKSKHKRTKTVTVALEQMDHPSKNITVQGYYPVGIQINPNGKYVSSTYKNTPSCSFGGTQPKFSDKHQFEYKKSPNKKEKRKTSQQRISYEFSPNKNKVLLPNGAELHPQINSYYRHLTDKKNTTQKKSIQQNYVPFSQFGNINAFRY